MNSKTMAFNTITLTPRHLSAVFVVFHVNSGNIHVFTDPPDLHTTWTATIIGGGTWNPATGDGIRTGAEVDWILTIPNLQDINTVGVGFSALAGDGLSVKLSEIVNTTINFP